MFQNILQIKNIYIKKIIYVFESIYIHIHIYMKNNYIYTKLGKQTNKQNLIVIYKEQQFYMKVDDE